MDHVEIGPADMIRNYNGRFPFRKLIPGHGDLAAIENFENALDPIPIGKCDERRGIVDGVRKEEAEGEENGEDQVHDDEVESPWYNDDETAKGGENISTGHGDVVKRYKRD